MISDRTSDSLGQVLWWAGTILLTLGVVVVTYQFYRSWRSHARPSSGATLRPTRWRGQLAVLLDYAESTVFAAVYWMLLSSAWLLTIGAAAIGGIIVAVVAWDLWPLGIVLVAGTLSGWFATLACFVTLGVFDTSEPRDTN